MYTDTAIIIIDSTHPDYNVTIWRWRLTNDVNYVEYRDGGIWSRLHTSQFNWRVFECEDLEF